MWVVHIHGIFTLTIVSPCSNTGKLIITFVYRCKGDNNFSKFNLYGGYPIMGMQMQPHSDNFCIVNRTNS